MLEVPGRALVEPGPSVVAEVVSSLLGVVLLIVTGGASDVVSLDELSVSVASSDGSDAAVGQPKPSVDVTSQAKSSAHREQSYPGDPRVRPERVPTPLQHRLRCATANPFLNNLDKDSIMKTVDLRLLLGLCISLPLLGACPSDDENDSAANSDDDEESEGDEDDGDGDGSVTITATTTPNTSGNDDSSNTTGNGTTGGADDDTTAGADEDTTAGADDDTTAGADDTTTGGGDDTTTGGEESGSESSSGGMAACTQVTVGTVFSTTLNNAEMTSVTISIDATPDLGDAMAVDEVRVIHSNDMAGTYDLSMAPNNTLGCDTCALYLVDAPTMPGELPAAVYLGQAGTVTVTGMPSGMMATVEFSGVVLEEIDLMTGNVLPDADCIEIVDGAFTPGM